ncbi:MAG: prolyl oligopeptidase family serine peptidase [bacterium]|nr:prolyl oligopeptidase family serine peptidase [bacterium]
MAEGTPTGFLDRTLQCEGAERRYQVYVPRDYDPAVAWPVILFLHGSGERGEDGVRPTQVGLGSAIRWSPERWPAIVVFPQLPDRKVWSDGAGCMALAALAAAEAEFHTDPDRVYLTGVSLGGLGTWQLAYEHPERFAALVPVCGFVEPAGHRGGFVPDTADGPHAEVARRLAQVPTWIFHGAADPVVPVEDARLMSAALEEAGAKVHYSELAGVEHNSWDPAYATESLPRWLFDQRRPAGGR